MSTDYFPPILRAVQGLAVNNADTRRALFDRARTALLRQLSSREPPLDEAQITQERLLLEDALRRVEAEAAAVEAASARAAPAMASLEAEAPETTDDLDEPVRPRPQPGRPPERRRPPAPRPRPERRGNSGLVAGLAIGAIVLVAAGVGAWFVLSPEMLQTAVHVVTPDAPAPASPPAPSGKLTDRLSPQSGDQSGGTLPATSPKPNNNTPLPATPTQPSPPPQTSAQAQPLAPVQPGADTTVAQRAVLYEEDPATQQQGSASVGTVTWRTVSLPGGAGQPLELAIRGDIDIPERKMKVLLTLRRNSDPALTATHTLQIQFTVPPDFPDGGVSNVPAVLMKLAEAQRGAPLSGLSVKVTSGYFLLGFSNAPADTGRNEQLLKLRDWLDIPILYNNGRRAILTINKGVPGERAFADAFTAWGSPPDDTTSTAQPAADGQPAMPDPNAEPDPNAGQGQN